MNQQIVVDGLLFSTEKKWAIKPWKDTEEIESILQNERRHEKAIHCINTLYNILEKKTMNSLRNKIRS